MKRRHHHKSTSTSLPITYHHDAAGAGEPVRIELKYTSPEAKKVYVAGDFNNWRAGELPLWREKPEPWKITLYLAPGRYQYRFIADGEWQDDPDASATVPNEFGSNNSVLEIQAADAERLIAATAG